MRKRNKDPKDLEHYRGKIKELISENKSLRRQLKKLSREQHNYQPLEDESEYTRDEDGMIEIKPENWCPNCSKNKLQILDLNIRKYDICTLCGYRKLK